MVFGIRKHLCRQYSALIMRILSWQMISARADPVRRHHHVEHPSCRQECAAAYLLQRICCSTQQLLSDDVGVGEESRAGVRHFATPTDAEVLEAGAPGGDRLGPAVNGCAHITSYF